MRKLEMLVWFQIISRLLKPRAKGWYTSEHLYTCNDFDLQLCRPSIFWKTLLKKDFFWNVWIVVLQVDIIKDLQATKHIISKAYGTFPHVHGSKLNQIMFAMNHFVKKWWFFFTFALFVNKYRTQALFT